MTRKLPLELLAWIFAIAILAFSNPAMRHYTLCPFNYLGISWCPGCGIGRSISSLLHFNLQASLNYHWFGIPAFFILLHRIWLLSKKIV
ncbi:DUF2752 domain-containing protein [Flavihumibacter sp. R14]|nr:DUF2752 domain-containing protein [Flavihumibacter soli]